MPEWFGQTNGRIGPKPPPLPSKRINVDPDYEVIDFSQTYSNAPPLPIKESKQGMKCELCGSVGPVIKCEQCDQKLFCLLCDTKFHQHPRRQNHLRKVSFA